MARWQLTRSSAKLFKAPSSWERRRNRGWICFIWSRVSRTESGTVRKNTPESRGESISSITKEPMTVSRLVPIWSRSVDRAALTVSTS